MKDCLFCKFSKGDIAVHTIYEDEDFLAFLDNSPYCEAHTLVIPKKHYRWMWDMPDEELSKLMKVSKKIANHYRDITGNENIYSFLFGEEIPHVHLHLLPNVEGRLDRNLSILSKHGRSSISEESLVRLALKYSYPMC